MSLLLVLPCQAYQTRISQSSTDAPSTEQEYFNDFSAFTLTWAYVSPGVYTITASAEIFTANKTHVFVEPSTTDLVEIKAVVDSTTQITLTVSLKSVSIGTLIATPTNALITNRLFEIRVYP